MQLLVSDQALNAVDQEGEFDRALNISNQEGDYFGGPSLFANNSPPKNHNGKINYSTIADP